MFSSPHLGLPYLAPAQAQKHVTVNEALARLDGLVQCAALELGRNEPPPAPAEGARYVTGPAPSGAWAGQPGRLALFLNGGWVFAAPRPGWRVYSLADDVLYVFTTGGSWQPLIGQGGGSEIQNATRIGLNTTASAATPFTAKLNAALWTARPAAEGGDDNLFLTINKGGPTAEAGLVLQTGFVTRAVAGLFGSNNFRLSVSQNGSTFFDALMVDNGTGIVDQPNLPRFKAHTNFDNYVGLDTWTRIAINTVEDDPLGAFDAGTGRFVAPAAGSYLLGATLLYKVNANTGSRMRGRLVRNGSTEIRGAYGEISGAHLTMATALWLQTLTPLAAGDTVELQGYFRAFDGFFAAHHTSFWGCKIG